MVLILLNNYININLLESQIIECIWTIIPYNIHIRILISSEDVIYAWTVPFLGVKTDAIPGRLNQVKFIRQRPGVFLDNVQKFAGQIIDLCQLW